MGIVAISRRGLSLLAVCLLTNVSGAQTAGFLKVTTLEGEGAFNDVKRKLGHPPLVRVVDESDALVAGAEVTFSLPEIGPGAIFAGGGQTAVATTDAKGLARCPAFIPNAEEGRFRVRVVARYRGKTGTMLLTQSNTAAGGTSISEQKRSKAPLWLALIGGGVTAGVLAATRHGSSAPAAVPATTLSTAGLTVGGPR